MLRVDNVKDEEQYSRSKVLQRFRRQRQSSWTPSHSYLVWLEKQVSWFGELPFHDAEHHHRGQVHKHVRKRRQDDRRRTNRTHRVGALPRSHPGLCGTLVGRGEDTHGTPVPPRRKAVGGPETASHATPKREDQGLQRHALVTNMEHNIEECKIGLFQNASCACDFRDSISTSGGSLCVLGSHTFVPIS